MEREGGLIESQIETNLVTLIASPITKEWGQLNGIRSRKQEGGGRPFLRVGAQLCPFHPTRYVCVFIIAL